MSTVNWLVFFEKMREKNNRDLEILLYFTTMSIFDIVYIITLHANVSFDRSIDEIKTSREDR